MDNNFRKTTADYFVSKAGSDSTGNGTRENPFNSLVPFAYENRAAILGAGSYLWPILQRTSASGSPEYTNVIVLGDGLVKCIGDAATPFTKLSAGFGEFNNIYFDKFGGFHFGYGGQPRASAGAHHNIFKVVAENSSIPNSLTGVGQTLRHCIFINLNGDLGVLNFENCLFFNCTLKAGALRRCYVDPNSGIEAKASYGSGGFYDADPLTTGLNNIDPRCDTSLAKGININGAGWSRSSPDGISALPQFNSLAKEDWSLRKESPHITYGIGPEQYRYANTAFFEFSGTPGDTATTNNTQLRFASSGNIVRLASISAAPDALTFNSQGGIVRKPDSNGNGYSTIVTNPIPFADIPQEVTLIQMFAGLNYDANYLGTLAAPNPYNNNVPDYSNGLPGSAGRNPNRLTYRARWSTVVMPDINNPEHWVSGASWVEFEWNTKPLWLSSQLLGSGNPAFNASAVGVTAIVAKWLQIEITIRDNYAR